MSEQPRSIASLLQEIEDYRRTLQKIADFSLGFVARTNSHPVASHARSTLTVGDLRRCFEVLDRWDGNA